jgi:hypothetical protein
LTETFEVRRNLTMRKILLLALFVSLFAWGFQLAPLTVADAQDDNADDNYTAGILGAISAENVTGGDFIPCGVGVYMTGWVVASQGDTVSFFAPPAADCTDFAWTAYDWFGNDVTADALDTTVVATVDQFPFAMADEPGFYLLQAVCTAGGDVGMEYHIGVLIQ